MRYDRRPSRRDLALRRYLTVLTVMFALLLLAVAFFFAKKLLFTDSSSRDDAFLSSDRVPPSSIPSTASAPSSNVSSAVSSAASSRAPSNPNSSRASSRASSSNPYPDVYDETGAAPVNKPANLAAEVEKWYLRLAGAKNPLPQGYAPELAYIHSKYANSSVYQLDKRAVDALHAMCAAAEKDGVKLTVISPYRSIKKQTELFEDEVRQVMKTQGVGREKAESIASKDVLPPGHSEHNLGLAVDFNLTAWSFENTVQFRWLREHAPDYGFVLRYPKDKTEITGVNYEPWHYRYVGVYHAKQMTEKGMVLEEYLEYLRKAQ